MTGAHRQCHRDLSHFMAGTADVEEDLPLSQQDEYLRVYEARGKRIRICADDLICRQVRQGVRGCISGEFRVLTLRPCFGFCRQRQVSRSYDVNSDGISDVREELRC
jgi:hypothetical protein